MPAPQFMKQISAERNFTSPGTLLRLDPEATSAGATHLMVLGKDDQENIILLPGHSRSELLGATGDVHCWVLPLAELEALEPKYDGKIPDHLRLVSVDAQDQFPFNIGDKVQVTENIHFGEEYYVISIEQWNALDDSQMAVYGLADEPPVETGRMVFKHKAPANRLVLVEPSGNTTPIPQVPIGTKFTGNAPEGKSSIGLDETESAGPCEVTERAYYGGRLSHPGWTYSIIHKGTDPAFNFLLGEEQLQQQLQEHQEAPEIEGEDDIVIARKVAAQQDWYDLHQNVLYEGDGDYYIKIIIIRRNGVWYRIEQEHDPSKAITVKHEDVEGIDNGYTGFDPVEIPQPKFNVGEWVAWVEKPEVTGNIMQAYFSDEYEEWRYYLVFDEGKPTEEVSRGLAETELLELPPSPEIEGEQDLVIAQSQPKKITYDPDNPGQYFYLERPAEEAPPATPVDEAKIPEYLYEKKLPVQKNVKPSTPVMQDLRQDLKDPDRMLKALAIHIHELETLRTNITKFSENVNAVLDYARRGLEQVQVSGEDEPMTLREVAPFKHRDPMGNLMAEPERRKEWVKARQAVTILDKIRSGLETTGLMVVNFRGVVYELRHETELIVRASQHVTDPKVAGFRDWAMTFNEFSVWWNAKRIEQNRQIKDVQGALRKAWKRYRTKHAFFYKRILTRFGKLKKLLAKVMKRISVNYYEDYDQEPRYRVGDEVATSNRGVGTVVEVMLAREIPVGAKKIPVWKYKVKHDNGETWVNSWDIGSTEPKYVAFAEVVDNKDGRTGKVGHASNYSDKWYYQVQYDDGTYEMAVLEDRLSLKGPESPEITDEEDIVVARKVKAQGEPEYDIGQAVWERSSGKQYRIVALAMDEMDGVTLDEWLGEYVVKDLNGTQEEISEDDLIDVEPEFAIGQDELQWNDFSHEECTVESMSWEDDEWKYTLDSSVRGRHYEVPESEIGEYEEAPKTDFYIALYGSSEDGYEDRVIGTSTNDAASAEGYWANFDFPFRVVKFGDMDANQAAEYESMDEDALSSYFDFSRGTLVIDQTWAEVLGGSEFEGGDFVVWDGDERLYAVKNAYPGIDENGEGSWLYELEWIEPDWLTPQQAAYMVPLLGEDDPSARSPVPQDNLTLFDDTQYEELFSQEAPEIEGEDDIIIAQKESFDEIQWLTEVENDLEEVETEVEMMNEFYSQAAEQQQELATKREVYETNYGDVPGDPAVVDVPMAAAARAGELVNYIDGFEDAEPLTIRTARVVGVGDEDLTVVDNEGKTVLVARGMVVTSQGEKIRRRRKRRKVKPIEEVKETDPTDILEKTLKTPKPKKKQPPENEKIQLVPMKQQPKQPAVPEGTIPVSTPPEQVGAEPVEPVPQEVQQPVAPVVQPVQLIQQTPPPPSQPAPPPVPAPEEMDAVDFADIPDEEWRNLTNAEKIRMAAVFNRIMIIEYQKITAPEEGVIKSYQVEPYSYRVKRPKRTGGTPVWYLFAHDVIDNHIKAFIVRNIRDVEIVDQSFAPRWDVEFTYNPRWERFKKKTTKPGTPPSDVELTEEGFEL